MRVGDLGRRGLMATSTTVNAMLIIAMVVTVVAMTTARTMGAPMLARRQRRRRPRVGGEGSGRNSKRARGRRARVARVPLFDADGPPLPQHARRGVRMIELDMRRERPVWPNAMALLKCLGCFQNFAKARTSSLWKQILQNHAFYMCRGHLFLTSQRNR
eukprot:7748478-Pyramimonas_sp.AAC.1